MSEEEERQLLSDRLEAWAAARANVRKQRQLLSDREDAVNMAAEINQGIEIVGD